MNFVVLIVDDSLTVRMDLADAFLATGFRPVCCATITAARAALKNDEIAVIVLDVVLPDEDGLDWLRELRAMPEYAKIPVLLLSTEAEVRDRIRGLETGADDYVGKPYDTGYVTARAGELVRNRELTVAVDRPSVLIIDDSLTFRERLRGALQSADYIVMTASSGEEGLRIAAANRPTAILVDGVMPGLDGEAVIRRIRLDEALRGTSTVLLTAAEETGAELRALDAGADAFVRKEEDLDVILARIAAVIRNTGAVRAKAHSLLGPMRILAVDDSPTYLDQLATMLRGEGYDVVLARSGEEAIEMLTVQPVDCILLDVVMPGTGGIETCKRIKASPGVRDIPLIMLTAREDRATMIDGLSIGADDFIAKSSEFEVLKARVRAQLRRKQFDDEHRKIRNELLRSELAATGEKAAREVAEARAALVEQLERKNRELEAFSYSVSHDLRAPLRSIQGFTQALMEDYGEVLKDDGRVHLQRVQSAAQRMGELIDDLLELSRVSRLELNRTRVNLSDTATLVLDELRRKDPEREISIVIAPELHVDADGRLMRVLLENLLGNAWKFTSKATDARIELGRIDRDGGPWFFVRDNGAGFNMKYADKLFSPFQRLHNESEFGGTGIGLATVQRIVDRHSGRVTAEGEVGVGATVSFSVPSPRRSSSRE